MFVEKRLLVVCVGTMEKLGRSREGRAPAQL
jgi:hypothetical protein